MRILTVLIAAATLCGCVAIRPNPDRYDLKEVPVRLPRGELPMTLVTPVRPSDSKVLILFATGDAGWYGTSHVILQHLVDRGFVVAAYDSRRVVSKVEHAKEPLTFEQAATGVDTVLVASKKALGLPDATPVIVTGFSRGASLVVFAAGEPSLQRHIAGGVALALTAESDYIQAPDPAHRTPAIQLDAKGRILTYPAIARLGSIPIAVIQSAGDKYVPAAESRRLFGPDTTTRRLYEVDASNHGFSGGQEAMLKDLDEALDWIVSHPRN
jgi:dienelactone hydrolase